VSPNKPASLSNALMAVKGQAAVAVSAPPEVVGAVAYYKSLTLKVDKARYTKLKLMGATREKTTQDLLIEAVDLFLAKNK
jgi:hypothetical protein